MHRVGFLSHCCLQKPLLNPSALNSVKFTCAFSSLLDSAENYNELLKSCNGLVSLKRIHSLLTTTGFITKNPHFGVQIIIHYAKYGDPKTARSLFDRVCGEGSRSFLCNTMIRAYANGGHCMETLELYSLMRRTGISPNNFTFPFVLKACAVKSLILEAKAVHGSVIRTGFDLDGYVEAALLFMYAKSGEVDDGCKIFDKMLKRDLICWSAMITAYRKARQPERVLILLQKMKQEGLFADSVTLVAVACAIGQLGRAMWAQAIHASAIRTGLDLDLYVEAALVDMYGKSGLTDYGRRVFDEMPTRDLVCWTAMITAYEQAEHPGEALLLFRKMQQEGLRADSVSLVSVASAVGVLEDAVRAESVHAYAICSGFLQDLSIGNSLVSMYAKCRNVEKARLIFDRMEKKDGITWNSMLSGYAQNGQASEALLLFDEMLDSGCVPNPVTALIMVSACAYLGSCQLGRKLHNFIIDNKIKIDLPLSNALMDMYAKCGDLDTAVDIFNQKHPSERDVTSWNVLISGYGMHGYGKESLEIFSRMQEEGMELDHITFTSILSACSHAGLIDEGRKCFADMTKHSVTPQAKHYACMVDMLGRAGLLCEAYDLIKGMPSQPNDAVWGALLLACRIHGNAELGEIAAKNLFQIEPDHPGYYVLLSNVYATSNKWQEVGKLRQIMKDKGLKKPAAFSVIELDKEIYGFYTADQVNPYRQEVYKKVESLVVQMKMAGYVPDLSCALHDVEDEDKEQILKCHSEKLAVAFGIMKIDPGLPLRVTKNLRVCNDCHSAFKFMSYICDRNIVVRDANRFHHFQGGTCSCKDYW